MKGQTFVFINIKYITFASDLATISSKAPDLKDS